MDCRFMWYNLPNRIKEIIAPYNDQLSDEAKKVTYINSTTEISISKEQIEQIAAKVLAIRDKVINTKS